MYLDFTTFLFVILCLAAFAFSSGLIFYLRRSRISAAQEKKKPLLTFLGISVFVILIELIYLSFVQSEIGIAKIFQTYFSGQNGNQIKEDIMQSISSSKVGWTQDLSSALMVFVSWYFVNFRNSKVEKLFFYMTLVFFLISSLLTISRDAIISFIIMFTLIYISKALLSRNRNLPRLLWTILIAGTVLLAFFLSIDSVRNRGVFRGKNQAVIQLMGYFPASYNRLSAVLNGDLEFPNSGSSFYTMQFFWDFPVLSNALELYTEGKRWGLDLPNSAYENWKMQFRTVYNSPYNKDYIWLTAFGFVFLDLKWFSVLYFLLYGAIAGASYRYFLSQNVFGIIMYPYIVATIMKWWSIPVISQRSTVIFLIASFLIYLFWYVERQARKSAGP